MRTLFLLSGAPGTGKSTLIRELGVENLALGYDMFRKLFSATFPCLDISGLNSETLRMPQEAEYAAVLAAREALKARLAAGTTVFFDSTSSRESDQTELAKLGEKYGYRTVLIDCQGDTTIETLLQRNRRRGVDQVDAETVVAMHERCAAKPVSPLIDSVIDGTRTIAEVNADISKFTKMPTLRIPSGGRVAVVGDVHSCAAALADAVHQMDRPNTHWVFAGDLFDRGPDPVGVMSIVERLISEGRGTVVTGNHEANLRVVNTMYELTRFTDTRTTRTALLNAGISDEQQLAFVNSTVPALHIHFEGRDQPWLVTHGGVGALTHDKIHEDGLLNVSDAECVYGFGERGRTYRGKTKLQRS